MVITCPRCSNSFCAGSKNKCEDACKGFIGGQMDVDHRCPMCRMSVKEWICKEDDVSSKKDVSDSYDYTEGEGKNSETVDLSSSSHLFKKLILKAKAISLKIKVF